MIYFVRSHKTGHIKIGHTANIDSRFHSLKTRYGKDIQLLGIMDGEYKDEQNLHRRFSRLWIDGTQGIEWFVSDDRLLEYIVSFASPYEPKKPANLIATNITVSRRAKQKIKMIAVERNMSINQLVCSLLQKQLEQEGIDVDLAEGLEAWGGGSRKDTKDDE